VLVLVLLLAYFKHKMPDLEVLLKRGTTVEPMWSSELLREAVLLFTGSITATFLMFIVLACVAFKQLGLLRAAAKELGISNGQPSDGAISS